MPKPTLDDRIARDIGLPSLTRAALAGHRLRALNGTLARVVRESAFYAKHLRGVRLPLPSLEAIAALPFTTSADLIREPESFRCVPPGSVERIVTLRSSGTTAQPKRIFFTRRDLDDTRAYFAAGLTTLLDPGEAVFILYAASTPNSVGDLLAHAARDAGTRPVMPEPGEPFPSLVRRLERESVRLLAGDPLQLLELARFNRFRGTGLRVPRVLLSADSVPDSLRRAVEQDLGAEVFAHYGSRETGYGGGLECAAHRGCHMREADLLIEAVEPETGVPLCAGETGELVVTVLRREGTPLIRYRTGDEGRRDSGPCPCGTVLETWSGVRRIEREMLPAPLCCREALEDAAFALPSVLDVRVRLWDDRIEIVLATLSSSDYEPAVPEPLRDMIAAVRSIPVSLVVRGRSEPDLLPRRKRRIERIPGEPPPANPTLTDPTLAKSALTEPAENDREPA